MQADNYRNMFNALFEEYAGIVSHDQFVIAFSGLSDRQQQALELKLNDGCSVTDMAAKMNLSVSHVTHLVHSAKSQLKRKLVPHTYVNSLRRFNNDQQISYN